MRLLKRRRKVTKSVKQQVFLEGRKKKEKEIHAKLCIKENNVRLIQSVSTVKWVFVPGGSLWPRAVTLPSYSLHFQRLPLISSLTAVRLKQMRSESCFDWWLSGLWWVPLSSAGWRPRSMSSFPQPFSSSLFLRSVPFWFASELFPLPSYHAVSLLHFICVEFHLAICLFDLFSCFTKLFFTDGNLSTTCTILMVSFSLLFSCFLFRRYHLGGHDLRWEAIRRDLHQRYSRPAGKGRASPSAANLHNRRLHGHGQMYVCLDGHNNGETKPTLNKL